MPLNDPTYLVPAMAAVTEQLGFAVTVSTDLRPAVPGRAAAVDARRADRRPRRLEHRHLQPRQRRAPARPPDPARRRRALRPRRRLHGRRLQTVGVELGGRRRRDRQAAARLTPSWRRSMTSAIRVRSSAFPASISSTPTPQRTPVLLPGRVAPSAVASARRRTRRPSSSTRRRRRRPSSSVDDVRERAELSTGRDPALRCASSRS